VPWWTWLALGVFLASVVGIAVFAAFAYGRLKRFAAAAKAIEKRLDELARSAEELEKRMEAAQARAEEAEAHAARLERSLERLGVLTWALRDARKDVKRIRELYLSK
jgi:septal ring factor EnvC (AmiA/AmiB activator)